MNHTGFSPRRTTSPTIGELAVLCSLLIVALGAAVIAKIS